MVFAAEPVFVVLAPLDAWAPADVAGVFAPEDVEDAEDGDVAGESAPEAVPAAGYVAGAGDVEEEVPGVDQRKKRLIAASRDCLRRVWSCRIAR